MWVYLLTITELTFDTFIDWRGVTSGGRIIGQNYKGFQRFRLVDIAVAHPHILDIALTQIAPWIGCADPECDIDAIKAEYNISGKTEPREDSYQYKFVVDVDGNSFSGRFWSLMTSGSLVFKVSIHSLFRGLIVRISLIVGLFNSLPFSLNSSANILNPTNTIFRCCLTYRTWCRKLTGRLKTTLKRDLYKNLARLWSSDYSQTPKMTAI